MNDMTKAVDCPKHLNLSLSELHRAIDDLNGKGADPASASEPFPCGCVGCGGCHGCGGCRGCGGCHGCGGCGCRGCGGCRGCEGCRGCRGCGGCHITPE